MNYILYRHIRKDKDEVFYIGIGEYSRSTDFKWGRNKYWRGIYDLNNQDIEVEILFEDLTWKEACEKEIWWIKFYGRKDLGEGTLCNLTDGGEGAYGRKMSEEAKQKMRETNSKKPHPMLGKTHSKEARKKISEVGRNRPVSEKTIAALRKANIGKKRTPEQLRFLDRTGIVPGNAIKVINIKTKVIYSSIKAASKESGLCLITFTKRLNNSSINNTDFKFL